MEHRWVCLTHQMTYPHSVHRWNPADRDQLPLGTEQTPCRPVNALVVPTGTLEA